MKARLEYMVAALRRKMARVSGAEPASLLHGAGSLKDLRDLSIVLAAVLYFIGWSYAYIFYDSLGVPVSTLDLPVHYFFVYAFPVLYSFVTGHFLSFLVALLIVGLILAGLNVLRAPRGLMLQGQREAIFAVVAIFLTIAFFGVLFEMTRVHAETEALLLRHGHAKRIRLQFVPEAAVPPRLAEANAADELRLVTRTSDAYVVLRQPPPSAKLPDYLASGQTFLVEKSIVTVAEVMLLNDTLPASALAQQRRR